MFRADFFSDLIYSVDNAVGVAEMEVRRKTVEIAVTASGRERLPRNEKSGTRDFAGINDLLESHVNKLMGADIAAGCKARIQGVPGIDVRVNGFVNRRFAEKVLIVIALLQSDVRVAIDQPWKDPGIAQVSHDCPSGDSNVRADRFDPLAFDQNDDVFQNFSLEHIDEVACFYNDWSRLSRCQTKPKKG